MPKLSEKFKTSELQQMRKLPKAVRETMMLEHRAKCMEDLDEEGHIFIQVPVKDFAKVDAIKSAIAEVMNLDEDSIEMDERNVIYAEMVLGSHELPWPVFAYELFTQVNEAVSRLGHKAEATF